MLLAIVFRCATISGMKNKPKMLRERTLRVRMTVHERNACEAAAARAGMTLSAWARREINAALERRRKEER